MIKEELQHDHTFLLNRKMNIHDVRNITRWALKDDNNLSILYALIKSDNDKIGSNALWCMTHLQKQKGEWLQSQQNDLIDMLLNEQHTGKKRMLLQLLREQTYTQEHIRPDFLDFCLSKINSECEPYAIRCFSIYCAFNMCRLYPELIAELGRYLDMLDVQILTPGLASALRKTRKRISAL